MFVSLYLSLKIILQTSTLRHKGNVLSIQKGGEKNVLVFMQLWKLRHNFYSRSEAKTLFSPFYSSQKLNFMLLYSFYVSHGTAKKINVPREHWDKSNNLHILTTFDVAVYFWKIEYGTKRHGKRLKPFHPLYTCHKIYFRKLLKSERAKNCKLHWSFRLRWVRFCD